MNQIYYPTIDLFRYTLKNALNLSSESIKEQEEAFLAQFPDEVQNDFTFPNIETEFQPLYHNPNTTKPTFKLKTHHNDLSGYVYPVVLNDVYGVQIDCSVDNLTQLQETTSFARIKTEIDRKVTPNRLDIGQTWIITGWLKEGDLPNAEIIAQACYQDTFGNDAKAWKQCFYSQSDFFQGKLFELWHGQSATHIVIILFPNKEQAIEGARFYQDWMGLFCYRHKITWAYQQTRLIKKALENHYRKVEENAQIIKVNEYGDKRLKTTENLLDNIQNILNQYTTDLLNLSFQKQIIETNLYNYKTITETIEQRAATQLNYLDKFEDLVENKYATQIDKDLENMQLGMKLLENNLQAMSSRIELEKVEREQNFQKLVTIIGTGIAGANLIKVKEIPCKDVFEGKLSFVCQSKIPVLEPIIAQLAVPILVILIFGFLGWTLRLLITR